MQEAIEETAGREMTVENTDRLDVLCRDKRQTAEAFTQLRESGEFIPALEMGKLQEAVENPAALTEQMLDGITITAIDIRYMPSSGVKLHASKNQTTTILGSYSVDTQHILKEMGNIKSIDFGPRNGGFNLLNTPDELYSQLGPEEYWEQYNKPWLDNAIMREDVIVLATRPTDDVLYRKQKYGDEKELTGFGREYFYLLERGYRYDTATGRMIMEEQGR